MALLRGSAAQCGHAESRVAVEGASRRAARAPAIGLERSTTENYVKLLEAVFLVHRLPAWGTTLGSRVVKHPKVHILDSGVMARLLSLTPEKITQHIPPRRSRVRADLLETFAVGEILKQVSW